MNHTDKEVADMDHYHITFEQRPIYRYKHYQYQSIKDAINFARLDQSSQDSNDQGKVEG